MKTLLIRFGSLGDILLTLPVLRDLVASGGEEIHYLVLDEYRELLEPLPELARIHSLPRGANSGRLRQLAGELAAERFDLVLDLHVSPRSRLLRLLLAGRYGRWRATSRSDLRRRLMLTGSWNSKLGRLLLGGGVRKPLERVAQRHRQSLAVELGPCYRVGKTRPYPVSDALRADVDAELLELGLAAVARPLGLAPGAAWALKAWPRFAELIPALPDDVPLLLFGGPAEEELCCELAETRGIAFCGARPLPRVAAALARCRLLVTGDTGLGHLNEALGRPVLSLFGPTVPAFGFAPGRPDSRVLELDLPCRPCSLHGEPPCRLGHHECLAGIGVRDVLATLGEMDAWSPATIEKDEPAASSRPAESTE